MKLTNKQTMKLQSDLLGLARHCLEQKTENERTINEDNLLENIKYLQIGPVSSSGRIDNSI